MLKAALAGTSKRTKKRNCVSDRGVFPGLYDWFIIRRVFAMERALAVIPLVFSCSACISHPAQFQSLTVKVEKMLPVLVFRMTPGSLSLCEFTSLRYPDV